MTVITIAAIITVLVILSLIFSGISHSRQQALAKRKKTINQCLQQFEELSGHIELLLKADPEYQLLTLLQSLAIRSLQNAHNLSPNDPTISDNLAIQQKLLTNLKENKRENKVIEFLDTVPELNLLKSEIGQLLKAIDIYKNRNILTIGQHQIFYKHLNKLNFDLTVNSLMNQANIAGKQNDTSAYKAHIQQAREMIKRSELEEDEKNKRVKELTELINEVNRTNKIPENLENTEQNQENSETEETSSTQTTPTQQQES